MNKELLAHHIDAYVKRIAQESEKYTEEILGRQKLVDYYKSFTKQRLAAMSPEQLYEYVSKLWAMLIWGNKQYAVDKILERNGLHLLNQQLSELVWSGAAIEQRWDTFRKNIKGIGPAMISEILCKTHPNDYMLWNRRAFVALAYLGVPGLPRYDYQLDGATYKRLCSVCQEAASSLKAAGLKDTTLLAVDYFFWDELQVEENLSKISLNKPLPVKPPATEPGDVSQFIHDDIRDKLRDIGQWLGFTASIEQKVSDGSRVDTIWEATIGNMGRVIYLFEVQTKGSIDSLILNLLKSLNNPAVQGVVAVSDSTQLERIRKHAHDVKDLRDKLRCWDYEEVLKVHESLEFVNSCINNLRLVPEGFLTSD